jgi:hypothetical protein
LIDWRLTPTFAVLRLYRVFFYYKEYYTIINALPIEL